MWNGCSEMRERKRKEQGKNRNRKEEGLGKHVNFWNCYFYVCNQESENPEGK
jgi:hypothetical protein